MAAAAQAAPSANLFLHDGRICAQDLDYDFGFSNIYLPSVAAEDVLSFRVDVTTFTRSGTHGSMRTGPRRIINKASALHEALRNGTIAAGRVAAGQTPNPSAQSERRISIVTIPQQFSGGPLCITRTALQDVIQTLDLPTTFLPVLYAFGSVPRISEAGLDCFTAIHNPINPDSFSLTYLYRFKEKDDPNSQSPEDWRDRQIGVFHRHNPTTNEDLFIILQPHPTSLFDNILEDDVQPNPSAMQMLDTNPFCLHQLLISTYFVNWRQYLRDVATEFEKCSAGAFSQDVVKDYSLEFGFLQRWRNIADQIVPISSTLDSITRIVTGLDKTHRACTHLPSSPSFTTFIQLTTSQTTGLIASAIALEKRGTNISDLLTNTIETRNQEDAAALNRHMQTLTVETVDDSTSVKIITFLSLFYLPGSFVATLFGMNLFGFDQENRVISIASNFWLYIVIFLPLTAITSGAAWLLSEKARKKRDARFRQFGIAPRGA